MENIFFDPRKLKHLGKNVIIGKTVRIRHPELVSIGDNSVIDDFTYISAELEVGSFCQIASNTTILGGGGLGKVVYEDLSGNAPGCRIIAASDDYLTGLGHTLIPKKYQGEQRGGVTTLKNFVILGANTVVLPNVTVAKGVSTGAMTLLRKDTQEWKVYSGNPARIIGDRDKEAYMKNHDAMWKEYYENNESFISQ